MLMFIASPLLLQILLFKRTRTREGIYLILAHLCHSTNINVSMIKKMSYQKMFLVPISYIGWNNYIRLY